MNAQRFAFNALTAVAATLVAGCSSAPTKRANNGSSEICPACIRDAGVIGVVSTSTIPKFSVQLPMTREQAVNAWRQTLTYGSCDDENQSSLDERDYCLIQGTLGLGLGWVVAGALAGQAVGNTTAVAPERLRAGDLALHRAVADLNLQESVRRRVVARAAGEGFSSVRFVPKPFPPGMQEEFSKMATVMCATLAWLPQGQSASQYLSAQGVETVLEIQLVNPRLAGSRTVNPSLAVMVDGSARLFSLRDGTELASIPLRYRGEGRKFVAWAAVDAQALHGEIERCCENLAAQCVAGLFPTETLSGGHSPNYHHQTLASRR